MSGSSSKGKTSKSAALASSGSKGGGRGKGVELWTMQGFKPGGGRKPLSTAARQAGHAKRTLDKATRNNPKR